MSGECRICGSEHAEMVCDQSAEMLRKRIGDHNAIADQIDALLAEREEAMAAVRLASANIRQMLAKFNRDQEN